MKVTLIPNTENASWLCGVAAATCTDYPDGMKALRGAMACGHDSVLEHASFTFLIEGVSRVLLAQLTRHRLASFSVQSQRYVAGVPEVVMPPAICADPELMDDYNDLIRDTSRFYEKCLARQVSPEDARFGLLQGTATKLLMTMDARELRHFLSLRMCRRAQWEIRELACRMYALALNEAHELMRGAGPECLGGKCPEGHRCCGKPYTNSEMVQLPEEYRDDKV